MTNSTPPYTEELLHSLANLSLTQGRSAYQELVDGFWMVTVHPGADQAPEHLVTLSLGRRLQPAAQGLAWGLASLSQPGEFLCSGRTDRRGQFRVVDLGPGQYRLTYVLCIRREEDVRLLKRIDDPRAWDALDEAANDSSLPRAMRELVADVIRQHEEGIHWLADLLAAFRDASSKGTTPAVARAPGLAPSARQATPVVALLGKGAAGVPPPTDAPSARDDQKRIPRGELPTLTRIEPSGDSLEIRMPAELVPYGVIRVLAIGASRQQVLGTCLVGVPVLTTAYGSKFCSARVRLAEIQGDTGDPKAVDYYCVAAMDRTLPCFPLEEVQRLLKHPSVADNQDLERRVESLIEALKR